MTENTVYRVNPLDKINKIEDEKVRELCTATVKEAIKMTEEAQSNSAISQRLSHLIEINSAKLSKED